MKHPFHRRFALPLVILVQLLLLAGCGGDGSVSVPGGQSQGSLTVTTGSLPDGIAGVGYFAALGVNGGAAPYAWSLASGSSLPDGLGLNQSTGEISGVPTTPGGPISFEIRASTAGFPVLTGSAWLSITVLPESTLLITTATLPDGFVASSYSADLVADNGMPPYSWSLAVTSDPLPDGLGLNGSSGAITGTPTAPGNYSVTFEVSDSATPPETSQATLGITISDQLQGFTVTTNQLLNAVLCENYDATIRAAGSAWLPFTWSLTSGALPPGLRLSDDFYGAGADGFIEGRPLNTGTYSFTLEATDATGQVASAALSLSVEPIIRPLPEGYVGTYYSGTMKAHGGTQPYSWAEVAGVLPGGLVLDPASGLISGTPTAAGNSIVVLEATDATGFATTSNVQIIVNDAPAQLEIVTQSLPGAILAPNLNADLIYDFRIDAAGGTGSGYQWKLTGGGLPPGITGVSTTGTAGTPGVQLTGRPILDGNFAFALEVSDSATPPKTATASFTLRVVDPPFDFNGDGYNDLAVGSPRDGFYGLAVDPKNPGSAAIYLGGSECFAPLIDSAQDYALWVENTEDNDDGIGSLLASAGDFNGDGYDDFMLSSPRNDGGGAGQYRGVLYIYHGASSWSNTDRNLDDADVTIRGSADYLNFGRAISSIGDFNGDGYDDIVVGADKANDIWDSVGEAYIFFGRAGSNISLTSGDADVTIANVSGNYEESFAATVAGVGDFNKDGFDDVVVTVSMSLTYGPLFNGASLLYLGSATPVSTRDNTNAEIVFIGAEAGEIFGADVSGAGDFNADSYADILVGATFSSGASAQYSKVGAAYLFLGRDAVVGAAQVEVFAAEAELRLVGTTENAYFGAKVCGVGDVNGDGLDDIAVANRTSTTAGTYEPAIFVSFGSEINQGDPQATVMDVAAPIRLIQANVGDNFASSFSAGDFNSDGFSDLLVGSPGAYGLDRSLYQSYPPFVSAEGCGTATVFFGSTNPNYSIKADEADTLITWGITNTYPRILDQRFGTGVAAR